MPYVDRLLFAELSPSWVKFNFLVFKQLFQGHESRLGKSETQILGLSQAWVVPSMLYGNPTHKPLPLLLGVLVYFQPSATFLMVDCKAEFQLLYTVSALVE